MTLLDRVAERGAARAHVGGQEARAERDQRPDRDRGLRDPLVPRDRAQDAAVPCAVEELGEHSVDGPALAMVGPMTAHEEQRGSEPGEDAAEALLAGDD